MKKILSLFAAFALVVMAMPTSEAQAATIYYNKGTSGSPVWTTNAGELSNANWADNTPIVREEATGSSTVTATVENPDPAISGFLPATITQGTNVLTLTVSGSNFPAAGSIDDVYVDDPVHSDLMPAGTAITVPNENTIFLDYSALNAGAGLDTSSFSIGSWRVALRLTTGEIYKSDLVTLFTVNAPASAGPVLAYQSPTFEDQIYMAPAAFVQTFTLGMSDSDSNLADYSFNNLNANAGSWNPASDTNLDVSGGQIAYFSSDYTYAAAAWSQQVWRIDMTDGANPTNTGQVTFYTSAW